MRRLRLEARPTFVFGRLYTVSVKFCLQRCQTPTPTTTLFLFLLFPPIPRRLDSARRRHRHCKDPFRKPCERRHPWDSTHEDMDRTCSSRQPKVLSLASSTYWER